VQCHGALIGGDGLVKCRPRIETAILTRNTEGLPGDAERVVEQGHLTVQLDGPLQADNGLEGIPLGGVAGPEPVGET